MESSYQLSLFGRAGIIWRIRQRESHLGKRSGCKHTDEAKRKISLALTGKKKTRKHIENFANAQRGTEHTQEHKDKISNGLKESYRLGKRIHCYLGKTRTEDERRHISEGLKVYYSTEGADVTRDIMSISMSGDKNPAWKGGFSKIDWESAYGVKERFWRRLSKQIKERDGYMCQHCGKTKMLIVHHIIPRAVKIDNDPTNLVTLCASCHNRIEALTNNLIKAGLSASDIRKRVISNFHSSWVN